MEKLLASQPQKFTKLFRGQPVEGEVVSITDKEIILDINSKSEGVLQKKELSVSQEVKVGDKLQTFVSQPENENGQVILSLQKQLPERFREGIKKSRGAKFTDWNKFTSAQNQKSKLTGKVLEVNKGGLIVEVEGIRGFLPNSQVGFDLLSKSSGGMDKLIGQTVSVTVIEIDQANNKLIFSQRGVVSEDIKIQLKSFKRDQKTKGKILAILPFGLVVDVSGVEGLVFISDVSWERQEDLSKDYKVGEEIEVLVIGIDEDLGRLNLSIKQLIEDPFSKIAEKYPADEVVKGEVVNVSEEGVTVKFKDQVEGFLPASKMETTYEVGKQVTLLVDSVDLKRRRINLAPMITSTEGLIYK